MILNAGWGDDGAQTNIKTLGPAPFITTNLAFSSELFTSPGGGGSCLTCLTPIIV